VPYAPLTYPCGGPARPLPLYTRNPDDFRGLASLLEVHTVEAVGERSSPP